MGTDYGIDLLVQLALHVLMIDYLHEESIHRRCRSSGAGDKEVDQCHNQIAV